MPAIITFETSGPTIKFLLNNSMYSKGFYLINGQCIHCVYVYNYYKCMKWYNYGGSLFVQLICLLLLYNQFILIYGIIYFYASCI